MGKLDGKVAIVTGASRGIGEYIAVEFAKEGARVVCAARTVKEGDHKLGIEGSIETTVAKIKAAGGEAAPVAANLSSEDDCRRLVAETKRIYGPCDILVNNAALIYHIPTEKITFDRWMNGFLVSVHAPFMLSQMVLPDMIARKSGVIINISSEAAIGPGRAPYKQKSAIPSSNYGAIKAALERFTQGLAEEVYEHGITVAALAPSEIVVTPGVRFAFKAPADSGEPHDYMGKAAVILASEPIDKVSGWVTYDQVVLKQYGLIKDGKGVGFDRQGTGYSQI